MVILHISYRSTVFLQPKSDDTFFPLHANYDKKISNQIFIGWNFLFPLGIP